MRRRVRPALTAAAACGLLLAVGGQISGDSPVHPHGETYRSPYRGEAWHAFRNDLTREKWLESASGGRAPSVDDIVAREFAALAPLERVVSRDLVTDVSDPLRGEELVDVTISFRRQPTHDAGSDARAKYAPLFAVPLARSRAIASGLAERRADPANPTPEEDERLLTDDERAAVRAAASEVVALSAQMRREVCDRAPGEVWADQANVAGWLAARTDVKVYDRSWIVSTLSARVPLGVIATLATDFPEIRRITRIGRSAPTLSVSVPVVSASSFWNAGYNGSTSTRIAILDTGVDPLHPAITMLGYAGVRLSTAAWQPDFADNASDPDDYYGHGTHVAGIAVSTDSTNRGVAYGASVMNVKCGYLRTDGSGNFLHSDVYAAADAAATNNAAVMNASFGGIVAQNDGSDPESEFFDGVAFGLSIPVAISCGNNGSSSGTVGAPGDAFNVMTVGNFDDNGTTSLADDSINSGSSRGPTYDGRRKPDIAAPGTNITSCNHAWEGSNPNFVTYTGTSMASPHVAGALALLLDYGTTWAPEATKALLLTTANNVSPAPSAPGNAWGFGGLALGAAYAYRASVFETTFTSSGPTQRLFRLGSLAANRRVTLVWNRQVYSSGASAPGNVYPLIDMDLYVYDESTGGVVGSSFSAVNPVEQAQAGSAVTNPIVLVERYGSFPSGINTEYVALASETTSAVTALTNPTVTCSWGTVPSPVGPGKSFDMPVVVTNTGGAAAIAPVVQITLPTGYTTQETAGRITLGNIAAGGNATATFHVTSVAAPATTGSRTYGASATSTSYDIAIASSLVNASQVLDADAPAGSVVIAGGAVYTGTPNVTLTLAATDALTGVNGMRLRNDGGAWTNFETYATSRAWTLPSGDGTHTVDVEYRDGAGNTATFSDTIAEDTVPPAGAVVFGDGSAYTSGSSSVVSLPATDGASGVADQRFSTDGVSFGAWEPTGTTHTVTLPGTDGVTMRYAQWRDAVGNISAPVSGSVTRDTVAPTGSVLVNGGAAITNNRNVSVALSAADNVSGVAEMRFSFDGVNFFAWTSYATLIGLSLPTDDAVNTVYMQFRDGAGNTSAVYSDSIVLDGTGPAGSITIDGGAAFTAAGAVSLTLSAQDALSGVAAMRLRDEPGTFGAWQNFATSLGWTLPAGEGAKSIVVQFRDTTGNESDEYIATITRDLTPPAGSVSIAAGARAVNHAGVELTLAATDAASGAADVRLMNEGGAWSAWTAITPSVAFTLTSGEGTRRVFAQFRDAAGNAANAVSDDILVDMTPPTGSLTLNLGAALVLPWEPLSALPTSDDGTGGSGVVAVEFTNDDGATWTAPVGAVVASEVARPAAVVEGPAVIGARFTDDAGNVSATVTATTYVVAAPVQTLDAAKVVKSVIAPDGDVDAYTVDALQGDLISVKTTAKSSKKKGLFGAEIDVYDPSHAKLVTGRWPAGGKKPGVAKLFAPASGTYTIVVRASGGDAALGGGYTLAASVTRAKSRVRIAGKTTGYPTGAPVVQGFTFEAVDGALLSGTIKVATDTIYHVTGPDGVPADLVLRPRKGAAKLAKFPLTRGTGTYELRFDTPLPVGLTLTLAPGPRAKSAVETLPPGER